MGLWRGEKIEIYKRVFFCTQTGAIMYFLFFNSYNPKGSILLAPVLQMKKMRLLIFKIYLSIILFYK